MYTYDIDQTLLPTVFVSWATTKNKQFDKHYFMCCQTGIKKDTPENWMKYNPNANGELFANWRDRGEGAYKRREEGLSKLWVASGDDLFMYYLKWHEDIQRLEVAAVTIDTSRKPIPRQWTYAGSRWFIGKDKSVVDVNGNVASAPYEVFRNHTAGTWKCAVSMLERLWPCLRWKEEVYKLIGSDSFTTVGGKTFTIAGTWHLGYWLTHKLKEVKESKTQDFVNQLCALPLGEYSLLPAFGECRHYWPNMKQAYYTKLNDDWSCVRFFHVPVEGEVKETGRMYFSEDGQNQYVVKVMSMWVPSSHPTGVTDKFVNPNEAMAQSRRAKYILEPLTSVEGANITSVFMATLRRPELEQALKLGLYKEVCDVSRSHTVAADIKYKFGYYDQKQPTFLKQICMTKQQLDVLQSHRTSYNNRGTGIPMKIVRKMCGDDLTPISKELFSEYLAAGIEMSEVWSLRRAIEHDFIADMSKFLKNLSRLGKKDKSIYRVAGDAANAYEGLFPDTRPEINWVFADAAEAARTHDALDALRRQQYSMSQAERLSRHSAQCAKVDEERKVYEYEDEQFIIRLPRTLAEIVIEGQKQRICIGGYAETHAKGNTNLFFLRKKSAPDEPFFAIEMKNDKHIQQIHGSCNKWLGCNPEAIPTVMRWLRKNNIRCATTILTCAATGYGRTNTYVELPNID